MYLLNTLRKICEVALRCCGFVLFHYETGSHLLILDDYKSQVSYNVAIKKGTHCIFVHFLKDFDLKWEISWP